MVSSSTVMYLLSEQKDIKVNEAHKTSKYAFVCSMGVTFAFFSKYLPLKQTHRQLTNYSFSCTASEEIPVKVCSAGLSATSNMFIVHS